MHNNKALMLKRNPLTHSALEKNQLRAFIGSSSNFCYTLNTCICYLTFFNKVAFSRLARSPLLS